MAELKPVFTARAVAILTVGGVIGSGVFIVPTAVLRDSGGSVGLATMVWIVGGILSFLGAVTYAELSAANPKAGGLYLFLRDAFGPAVAFSYGWTLFVVIGSGTVATLGVASTNYLAEWVPMGDTTRKVVAVVFTLMCTMINVFGTKRSATIFNIGTALKVSAIVLLIVLLPIFGTGFQQVEQVWPSQVNGSLLTGAGIALVSVLWAYEGWAYLTFIAGETIEPQKNFPKGLALGTIALIVIYVLASVAYLAALGPQGVMDSTRVAADAAREVLGAPWGKLLTIPIIISMLTAAQANSMMASRVYYAMAKDGNFFKPMANVNEKYGTPAFAIVAAGIWSAVLAATGSFEVLLTYVVFVGWIFYALGGVALFVMRRRQPDAPRPFKVPGYPIAPLLFVVSGLAIVVNTVAQDPTKGMIGLGAALSSFPIYWIWQKVSPR